MTNVSTTKHRDRRAVPAVMRRPSRVWSQPSRRVPSHSTTVMTGYGGCRDRQAAWYHPWHAASGDPPRFVPGSAAPFAFSTDRSPDTGRWGQPAAAMWSPFVSGGRLSDGMRSPQGAGLIWGQSRVPMEPTVKARAGFCYSTGGGRLSREGMPPAMPACPHTPMARNGSRRPDGPVRVDRRHYIMKAAPQW
jgi:hypothetical protein